MDETTLIFFLAFTACKLHIYHNPIILNSVSAQVFLVVPISVRAKVNIHGRNAAFSLPKTNMATDSSHTLTPYQINRLNYPDTSVFILSWWYPLEPEFVFMEGAEPILPPAQSAAACNLSTSFFLLSKISEGDKLL